MSLTRYLHIAKTTVALIQHYIPHVVGPLSSCIHTSKDCCKDNERLAFARSLPDEIATITDPQKFKLAVNTFRLN